MTDQAVQGGPDATLELCRALEREYHRLRLRDLSWSRKFRRPTDGDVWQPGDEPYEQTVDFSELTVKELRMVRARSFRADLLHKLNVIRRWVKTWTATAKVLRVARRSMENWLNGRRFPSHRNTRRVDATYNLAIESMLLARAKRRKKS